MTVTEAADGRGRRGVGLNLLRSKPRDLGVNLHLGTNPTSIPTLEPTTSSPTEIPTASPASPDMTRVLMDDPTAGPNVDPATSDPTSNPTSNLTQTPTIRLLIPSRLLSPFRSRPLCLRPSQLRCRPMSRRRIPLEIPTQMPAAYAESHLTSVVVVPVSPRQL